jgi:hypothetical protein
MSSEFGVVHARFAKRVFAQLQTPISPKAGVKGTSTPTFRKSGVDGNSSADGVCQRLALMVQNNANFI